MSTVAEAALTIGCYDDALAHAKDMANAMVNILIMVWDVDNIINKLLRSTFKVNVFIIFNSFLLMFNFN